MENSIEIADILKEWVKAWRTNNGISEEPENQENEGKLSGEILDKFVADLQDEIINVIGDFGKNSIGENAKLVLYSGIDYEFVQEFCEASNGEYYMISRDCKKLDLFTHHKMTSCI